MVGNGLYNIDSVLARYAGGGAIALAGGEHVTRATSVTPETYPTLSYINETGNLPPSDSGSDEVVATLREEIGALREELKALRATTASGAVAVKGAVEEGNSMARDELSAKRRLAAKS